MISQCTLMLKKINVFNSIQFNIFHGQQWRNKMPYNNKYHPSSVMFLPWTLPSICHWTYFHTSKGHMTWVIKNVNRFPMHCGVAYESVCVLARDHVIRVCNKYYTGIEHLRSHPVSYYKYFSALSEVQAQRCPANIV